MGSIKQYALYTTDITDNDNIKQILPRRIKSSFWVKHDIVVMALLAVSL